MSGAGETAEPKFGAIGLRFRDKRSGLTTIEIVSRAPDQSPWNKPDKKLPCWNVVTVEKDGRKTRARKLRDDNLGKDYEAVGAISVKGKVA